MYVRIIFKVMDSVLKIMYLNKFEQTIFGIKYSIKNDICIIIYKNAISMF